MIYLHNCYDALLKLVRDSYMCQILFYSDKSWRYEWTEQAYIWVIDELDLAVIFHLIDPYGGNHPQGH